MLTAFENSMKTIKIWFVKDEEINNIVSMLPNNITTLLGTMQIHQIITKGNGIISYRNIGCFCGELKGLCSCFDLKTHYVRANTEIKVTWPAKPTFNKPNDEITARTVNFPIELITPKITSENLNFLIEDEVNTGNISSENFNLLIDEVNTLDVTSENLNLPVDEVATLEIVSMNMNLLTDELDTLDIISENLELPTDVELHLTDINLMPTHIVPDAESSSPGPTCVDYENKQKSTSKKTVHFLPHNTYKSYCPGPSSTKRDVFNCNKENKLVPKKSTKSNAIVSKTHIKFPNCSGCTCSILCEKAKCMACKKLYCYDCVGGPITSDYLCVKCLGESDDELIAVSRKHHKMIIVDIDKILTKEDLLQYYYYGLEWPWNETHFIMTDKCRNCDEYVIQGCRPYHFCLSMTKKDIFKILLEVDFWCYNCDSIIYDHYERDECEYCMSDGERALNFTKDEKNRFQSLIEKHKQILFIKKTDNDSNLKKNKIWAVIHAEFNAGGDQPRTLRQLKAKFDNMKRNARKNASQERQSRLRTGGGPPSPPVQPETEWFLSVMPISMDGLQSVVDDDLIEAIVQPSVPIFNNSHKILYTVSDMNILNENMFDSKSPAALLRTPVSKPLRIRKRTQDKSFHELKCDILQKTRESEEHIYQLKVKHMEEKRKEKREIYELQKKKLIIEINLLENKLQN
ncbi:unnamed protein product [Euphydryas editha]|uniref:Regulatory protein zeste n=1 Tax=Euphydryas editha TaxID=104508 RepID=A0AAU9UFK5_EUPED|nr:unnamed protein product [Euphydryas editha]